MTAPKSPGELYELYRNESETEMETLSDWNVGSINDLMAGLSALAVSECQKLLIDLFKRTYISLADGPEVTLGPDYLQDLATDHFGSSFARLDAQKATGTVTFSRATAAAGAGTIPAGTIVKTELDASGQSQSFETLIDVSMGAMALTVNASVRALVGGTSGNVDADAVTQIQTALYDATIEVNNENAFAGGAAAQDDATYREYIYNLILTLGKATPASIKAAALNVTGVEHATVDESVVAVREWDIATDSDTGPTFYIVRVKLYIADANGTADDALIQAVKDAIEPVRAAGVRVDVIAAEALEVDWTAAVTLNPSGPNYTELSSDLSPIETSMSQYISDLEVGDDFIRTTARLAIMAIWGPSGTNDITDFTTSVPSGDVASTSTQKLVPGDVSLS